jgi:hypothetical protein
MENLLECLLVKNTNKGGNGWDGLTTADKQLVEELAKSCVYINGYSVFKARMIYENAEPGYDYDDLVICTAGNNKTNVFASVLAELNSTSITNENNNNLVSLTENDVIVYPNPANTEIKIRHSIKTEGELRIDLFDYTGRKVKSVACTNCYQETTMNVENLADGIYTYKVSMNSSIMKVGKLNILK